ncbi:hypothetical protein CYMTET_24711 [Cymbomonas tetramitiformis]|uniref:RIH domain-containing protein n=1 Tax=Cymbomonas tetramitiformis TaxID=36881 RepID=A0AAE0FW44_9CHLO|nr:hypothetical protein CYMTET_24711 [Cymbomonas tetramitiformis]
MATRFKLIPYAFQAAVDTILRTHTAEAHFLHMAENSTVKKEPKEKPNEVLCAGTVMRIRHCESDGFLLAGNTTLDPGTPHLTSTGVGGGQLCFQAASAAGPFTSVPASGVHSHNFECHNSNSLWTLEGAGYMWGGARLTWNRLYRIKHVASTLYLCPGAMHGWARVRKVFVCGMMNPSGTIRGSRKLLLIARFLINLYNRLELTDDFMHRDTLWQLRPFERWREVADPDGRHGRFSLTSLMYLRNTGTGQYLTSGLANAQHSATAQVTTIPHEGCAMALHLVDEGELGCLWHVMHATHSIKLFLERLRSAVFIPPQTSEGRHDQLMTAMWKGGLSAEELEPWVNAFTGSELAEVLVRYAREQAQMMETLLLQLTPHSTNQNLLTREGTPNASLQRYLHEQHYVSALVNMLQELFERKALPPQLVDCDPVPWFKYLCQLAQRVLKQVCKDNPVVKRFLALHTRTFQLQLGTEMKSAYTLMEIYQENMPLVRSIEHGHVDRFLKLMGCHRKPRFVEFLRICAVCQGQPIPQNQNLIASFLRDHPGVLPTVKIEGQNVIVVDGVTGLSCVCNDYLHSTDDLLTRDTGTLDPPELLLLFYLYIMRLYAAMCLGRNIRAAQALLERSEALGVSYNCLLGLMSNSGVPFQLRRYATDLIKVLYIQNFCQEELPLVVMTHIWSASSPAMPTTAAHTVLDGTRAHEDWQHLDALTWSKMPKEAHRNFPRLKVFILDYLTSLSAFNVSNRGRNHLAVAVLQLLHCLFTCGFYCLASPAAKEVDAPTSPPSDQRSLPLNQLNPQDDFPVATPSHDRATYCIPCVTPSKGEVPTTRFINPMPVHDMTQLQPLVAPLLRLLDGCNDCRDEQGAKTRPRAAHTRPFWPELNLEFIPALLRQKKADVPERVLSARDPESGGGPRIAPPGTVQLKAERYRFSDETEVMMEAKLAICEALSAMFAMRLDLRLHAMRKNFERIFDDCLPTHVARFRAHAALNRSPSPRSGSKFSKLTRNTTTKNLNPASRSSIIRAKSWGPAASASHSGEDGRPMPSAQNLEAPVEEEGQRQTLAQQLRTRELWREGEVGRLWSSDDLLSLKKSLFDEDFVSPHLAHTDHDHLKQSYLVTVLQDLMRYEHPSLKRAAFQLLHQHMTQRLALTEAAADLQLLVSPQLVQAYLMARTHLAALSSHGEAMHNATGEALNEAATHCVRILDSITDLCKGSVGPGSGESPPDSLGFSSEGLSSAMLQSAYGLSKETVAADNSACHKFQTMLRHVGALNHVLYILQCPWPWPSKKQWQGGSRGGPKGECTADAEAAPLLELFTACHRLLVACVSAPCNPENQLWLWQHADKLMASRAMSPATDHMVAATLASVVRGNRSLAMQVPRDFVLQVLDIIKLHGREMQWLGFLQELVVVDGEVLEDARELVFFLLLDPGYRPHVCLLLNDAAGCMRRAAWMAAEEHTKRRSQLAYHVTLVGLLARCVLGGSTVVRHMARGIFSLGEVLRHILDGACNWAKAPGYLRDLMWSGEVPPPELWAAIRPPARYLVKSAFVR